MNTFQNTQAAEHPQHQSVGRGWAWIVDAWGMFKQTPGPWVGIVVVWFLIQTLVNLMPIISLAMVVLGPVFSGGILMAARQQDAGHDIGLGDLFSGFKSDRFGPLAMLGLLSLGLILSAVFLVAAVVAILLGGFDPDAAQLSPVQVLIGALLVLVLSLPVIMALWFATPLVALQEISPSQAFVASLQACLKNFGALTLFSLALIPLGIIAMIPLGLGLLVLAPVMMLAMYRAYIEIFRLPTSHSSSGISGQDLGWPE